MLKPIINTVGKHKIPRFIYHMTNKKNYEAMLADGVIKPSYDALIGKGVFATELTNLFKRWKNSSSWGFESLQEQLIRQVARGTDEIVMLKIPTAKLDTNKLVVRSQNRLFNWAFSDKGAAAFSQSSKKFNRMDGDNWLQKVREFYKNIIKKQLTNDYAEHLTSGAPAKMSGLYKQRKEAIEYVYFDNIPISDVEKIGEVNIKTIRKTAEYDPVRPMRSVFTKLLQGTPEVKGAELLSC